MQTEEQSRAAVGQPFQALAAMLERLRAVELCEVSLAQCHGRVLGCDLVADRDNPACNVSAMDGYAVRLRVPFAGRMEVCGEARIGVAPAEMPPQGAVRIVTGAPVPPGAEAVLRREDTIESHSHIEIKRGITLKRGEDIRRQGENIRGGEMVVSAGHMITPAVVSALSGFGVTSVSVFRKLRVRALMTGDEVLQAESQPQPWQLRDANGPGLHAMLAAVPWIEWLGMDRLKDDLSATRSAIREALEGSDVLILGGGVSMGDRDFVKLAIGEIAREVIFHGLPIRPGKPILGAVGEQGQAIFGLPGNPVSLATTARRLALIAMRKMAGLSETDPPVGVVEVKQPEMSNPAMWMFRPVRLTATGKADILHTKGSGDIVSAARADGFVEIEPATDGQRYRPFYPWQIV